VSFILIQSTVKYGYNDYTHSNSEYYNNNVKLLVPNPNDHK
jgi:hypothetical protein